MPVNVPRALVPAPSAPPYDSQHPNRPPSLTTLGPSVHSMAERCAANVDFADYSPPVLGVCAAALVVGLFFTFFGYRLFKATLFLIGCLFGSSVVYLILDTERLLPSPLADAGVSALAGVLFGLVTMLVEYVGLFMTGFLGGQLTALVVMVALRLTVEPTSVWLTIGVLFLTGVLLAQLTLALPRVFTVICTSLIGAALIALAADYAVQRFTIAGWLWTDVLSARRHPSDVISPQDVMASQRDVIATTTAHVGGVAALYARVLGWCWYGWAIAALWPALAALGVLVQLQCTARGYSHKEGYVSPSERHKRSSRHTQGGGRTESGLHPSASSYHHQHNSPSCGPSPNGSPIVPVASTSTSASRPGKASKMKKANTPYLGDQTPTTTPKQRNSFITLYRLRNKGDIICQSHMECLQRSNSSQRVLVLGSSSSGDTAQTALQHATTLTSVNSGTQLTDISVFVTGATPPSYTNENPPSSSPPPLPPRNSS